jgi:hypothetical protein
VYFHIRATHYEPDTKKQNIPYPNLLLMIPEFTYKLNITLQMDTQKQHVKQM